MFRKNKKRKKKVGLSLALLFPFLGYSNDLNQNQNIQPMNDILRVAVTSKDNYKENKVASSESNLEVPNEKPCVVDLYNNLKFTNTQQKGFSYTPPKNCPGPWSKVILENTFATKKGVQYDRTASLWLDGVNLFFGTTAEVKGSKWQTQSDITEYQNLLMKNGKGFVFLPNVLTPKRPGYPVGSSELLFYPKTKQETVQTPIADKVIGLGGTDNFKPGYLVNSNSSYSIKETFPKNITQAYLDVTLQSQKIDEQWFQCVPSSLAKKLGTCGNGAFREGQVYIDGQLVGIVPIFPKIYTGGVDPYLWRPTPAIETLNFDPYRVNLTPFASLLSDGESHTISIKVYNANDGFSVAGNLLLYLDKSQSVVKGAVTKNTLVDSLNVISNENFDKNGGRFVTASTRSFTTSGYILDHSGKKITTTVKTSINFSNLQNWIVSSNKSEQFMNQYTNIENQYIQKTANDTITKKEYINWPLSITFDNSLDSKEKNTWFNNIHQGYNKTESINESKDPVTYTSNIARYITGMSKTAINPIKNMVIGNVSQNVTQKFDYSNSNGEHIHHTVDVINGKVKEYS